MPFLSLLDDRAKAKGSRDPLGFESVWSQFGRRLVGNLTTITWSLNNFAVALTGFAIANRHLDQHQQVLHAFLRFEQLAAYMRYCRGDVRGILGITRVEAKWQTPPIRLGVNGQILSSQANYGLWGLYSTALAATGLVRGEKRIPTPLGNRCCDHFFQSSLSVWSRIEEIALHGSSVSQEEIKELASAFTEAIASPEAKAILAGHLLGGERSSALQRELSQLIPEYWKATGAGNVSSENLAIWLEQNGTSLRMRDNAREIRQIERVLSSGRRLFDFLISQHGEQIDQLVELIRQNYQREEMALVVPEGKFPRREHLARYASAMNRGEFKEAISALINLNADVMLSRSGAPWVEVRDNKLLVRIKASRAVLPPSAVELTAWENSYFLPSFIQIFRSSTGSGGEVK